MNASTLFRPEALKHRDRPDVGGFEGWRPPSFAKSAWLAAGIVLLAILLLVLGSYQGHVVARGVILPVAGLVQVRSPQGGQLQDLYVSEGQWVSQGTRLARVRIPKASTADGVDGDVRASLADRMSTLREERTAVEGNAAARRKDLVAKSAALSADLEAIERESSWIDRLLDAAQQSERQYQDLLREGTITRKQLVDQQDKVVELRIRQETTHRGLLKAQADRQAVTTLLESPDVASTVELSRIDRDLARLREELVSEVQRGEVVLVAPADGHIGALDIARFDAIKAGDVVVSIIPGPAQTKPPLVMQVMVRGSELAQLEVGQDVKVDLDAYSWAKFGLIDGAISEIASTPIGDASVLSDLIKATVPGLGAEPRYRVVIALKGGFKKASSRPGELRIGLLGNAKIVLPRRRLFDWLLPSKSG